MNLIIALKIVAILQLSVAVLNLFLTRILKWQEDLDKMSLLPKQVFNVHSWFISIMLVIFGVLTFRFADLMVSGQSEPALWIAAAGGIFWGIRTVIQMGYYSRSHWWGKTGRTVIHIALLLVYSAMSATYLWPCLSKVSMR
jgi:hypothetical protein